MFIESAISINEFLINLFFSFNPLSLFKFRENLSASTNFSTGNNAQLKQKKLFERPSSKLTNKLFNISIRTFWFLMNSPIPFVLMESRLENTFLWVTNESNPFSLDQNFCIGNHRIQNRFKSHFLSRNMLEIRNQFRNNQLFHISLISLSFPCRFRIVSILRLSDLVKRTK